MSVITTAKGYSQFLKIKLGRDWTYEETSSPIWKLESFNHQVKKLFQFNKILETFLAGRALSQFMHFIVGELEYALEYIIPNYGLSLDEAEAINDRIHKSFKRYSFNYFTPDVIRNLSEKEYNIFRIVSAMLIDILEEYIPAEIPKGTKGFDEPMPGTEWTGGEPESEQDIESSVSPEHREEEDMESFVSPEPREEEDMEEYFSKKNSKKDNKMSITKVAMQYIEILKSINASNTFSDNAYRNYYTKAFEEYKEKVEQIHQMQDFYGKKQFLAKLDNLIRALNNVLQMKNPDWDLFRSHSDHLDSIYCLAIDVASDR